MTGNAKKGREQGKDEKSKKTMTAQRKDKDKERIRITKG